jgi:hypothetical protein
MLQDESQFKSPWWEEKLLQLLTVRDRDNTLKYRTPLIGKVVTDYFNRNAAKTHWKIANFRVENLINYMKEFYVVYKNQNPPWFVINISRGLYIDLQIVHSSVIKDRHNIEKENYDIGFTIHLPVNRDSEKDLRELEIFKSTSYFSTFTYNTDDGMEAYVLNCETDFDLLDTIMQKVLVDLKGYQQEDRIAVTHFFA